MSPLRVKVLVSLGLAAITLLAYAPAFQNDFIDLDDGVYVTKNPAVTSGISAKGLRWAWTTFHAGYWQPMTWMSLQLDAELFGPGPAGFHATNMILQAANVVLLFWVLHALTGSLGCSALTAALFGVHPMHVESVAWVAERKDVLSAFFWILTLGLYGRFVQKPTPGRYIAVLVSLTLGLLAKPMLVTLPCVLLLLDYWPLGRYPFAPAAAVGGETHRRSLAWLVVEKVPMFVLVGGASVITLIAQNRARALIDTDTISAWTRVGNALTGYVWYLEKTFWPFGLGVFYPHRHAIDDVGQVVLSAVLLLAITLACVVLVKRCPELLVGWLWFAGTLFPVIGFFQAGDQATADRFSYIPHIGLFMGLMWASARLVAQQGYSWKEVTVLGVVLIAALATATFVQTSHWRNSVTLWEHTIAVTKDNDRAHANLGLELFYRGELERSADHFEEAIRLNPKIVDTHYNLGVLRVKQGDAERAIAELTSALELNPNHVDSHYNLAVIYKVQKDLQAAVEHLRRVVVLQNTPENVASLVEALDQLAMAQAQAGHFAKAVRLEREALALTNADSDLARKLHEKLRQFERAARGPSP